MQMEGLARMVQAAASGKGVERIRELNTVAPHTRPIVLRLHAAGDELKALIDDASQQCLPQEPGNRRFKGTPKSSWAKMYKQSWERDRVSAADTPRDGK